MSSSRGAKRRLDHRPGDGDLNPLPQILEGIPLRLRSIRVNLDRPNFALNPTSCDPFSVEADISGDQGASAALRDGFQVANCAILPFAPNLSLKLSGDTKRTGHPALKATLSARPGESNIAATTVTMPHTLFLDNAHIKAPCTRVRFSANACPPSSVLGTATAESPLLGQALEGPVYLRASSHKLPDLVAALRGQIDINLDGRIDRSSSDFVPASIGPRRAGDELHPDSPRRQTGLAGKQRKPLQRRPESPGPIRGPKQDSSNGAFLDSECGTPASAAVASGPPGWWAKCFGIE